METNFLRQFLLPFIFILFLTFPIISNAQCAGSDGEVTICDKDSSPRLHTLFTSLGGSPTAGGVWSADNMANQAAITNTTTGEIDTWKIYRSGEHYFTYTNNCMGSEESTKVRVNLGGYPGEHNVDGSANVCGDVPTVNLLTMIGSNVPEKVQDLNGVWQENAANPNSGLVSGHYFSSATAPPGVYLFKYITPIVQHSDGSIICPSREVDLELEVHRKANAGKAIDQDFCITDDFSSYTAVDLFTLVTGEDSNGVWSETSTNQLDDLFDYTINIEEIKNNNGIGVYTFNYTVTPPLFCEIITETVTIEILPSLEGTISIPNYCLDTALVASLTYNDNYLENGTYNFGYQVTTATEGIKAEIIEVEFLDGAASFEINSTLIAKNEEINLEIISLTGIAKLCGTINIIPMTFIVSDPKATATSGCVDTEQIISITDILLNQTGTWLTGTHSINYVLTKPNGDSITSPMVSADFVDGSTDFTIDASTFNIGGTYMVSLNIPDAISLQCAIETTVEITIVPTAISLAVVIDDACDTKSVAVNISAPILSSGSYEITYQVIEESVSTATIENTINFTGGSANYLVDITNLADGNYNIILKSIQDDTTACRTIFEFEETASFVIGGLPPAPDLEANQTFCSVNFGDSGPTLAAITVSVSGSTAWYASETEVIVLDESTALEADKTYWVANGDHTNSCFSAVRKPVTISLITPAEVIVTELNPAFCASENATVADLIGITPNGGSLVWYNAATGGTVINSDQVLENGKSYFASESLESGCDSPVRIEVIPSIYMPEAVLLSSHTLSICRLEEPSIADLENLVDNTSGVEISWFLEETGGEPLATSELLAENSTYYAESYDPITNCINPIRVAVTVDLGDCDPDDYSFFVPDGFTPNNDGKNDFYFIPNIEKIFPEFTLEIFNRYGTRLFIGDISNPKWNGSKNGGNGNTASSGVYFYLIKYNREGFKPIQGSLYLSQ